MKKEMVIGILKDYCSICNEIQLNKKILKEIQGNSDKENMFPKIKKRQEYLYKLKSAINEEIDKLPSREKNIINEFYILRWQWVRIAMFENYSQRRCRDYRDRGLSLLCEQFENNEIISNYK